MAKYKRIEYANLCGLESRTLTTYIARKKVKVGKDDLIDDSVAVNAAFLAKQRAKLTIRGEKLREMADNPEKTKPTGSDFDYEALEREKLMQQVEKLKNENRKLKLNNEKTVGAYIQVEHTQLLIIQLSEAIHLTWENEFEDVIVKWGGRFGLSREDITDMKAQKVEVSNISRVRAVAEAKKMLRRLQNTTSDKRGVGEHG